MLKLVILGHPFLTSVDISYNSILLQGTGKMTFETEFKTWTGFCVSSDGHVIIHGVTEENASIIHAYNRIGKLVRTIPLNCSHKTTPYYVLEVKVEGQPSIAVSCFPCQEICLFNTTNWELRSAYKDTLKGRPKPGKICRGPKGCIIALNKVKSQSVCLFDCKDHMLQLKGTFPISINDPQGMCFVESQKYGFMLVLTKYVDGLIQAAMFNAKEVIWEHEGKIDGAICHPDGITTDGSSKVFIADNGNQRILVLDADSGSVLRTIRPDIEGMAGLAWCASSPRLAVRHKSPADLKCRITFFDV